MCGFSFHVHLQQSDQKHTTEVNLIIELFLICPKKCRLLFLQTQELILQLLTWCQQFHKFLKAIGFSFQHLNKIFSFLIKHLSLNEIFDVRFKTYSFLKTHAIKNAWQQKSAPRTKNEALTSNVTTHLLIRNRPTKLFRKKACIFNKYKDLLVVKIKISR